MRLNIEMFDNALKACPLIPILRGITPQESSTACKALFDAGIRLLEIPLNSPNAIDSIRLAAAIAPEGCFVGAGTVLTTADVQAVSLAGGTFIISPNTDPEVIAATKAAGMISIPGFFTATEGFTAIRAGADYLKLFPAGIMGPGYVKDLKAVIKKPIIAVGGVGEENVASFLNVCAGAGIGKALYAAGRSCEELKRGAEALLAAIRKTGE